MQALKSQFVSSPSFTLVKCLNGLQWDEIHRCINYLQHYFQRKASCCVGYQVNQDFDYSPLFDFLNFNINNVGDPYINSNYGINSRMMERPVIEFFAELFHASNKDYWGYITSGGTEANMYGLYTGRVYLESSSTPSTASKPSPVAYFSEDVHYSIRKALRMLKISQQEIPSTDEGAIQTPVLINALLKSDLDSHPPLIVITMGTSFKGAYDDVEEIITQLHKHHINRFYIHVDAALGGLFLPFLEKRNEEGAGWGELGREVPIFDFRLPIGSIAVSGHKVIGAPCPCAVFITLRENMVYEWEKVDYIGSFDSTLAGSRNGLAAIMLWYAIAVKGFNGFRKQALQMLEMADYATRRIQQAGFNAWKNDLGLSVVFDRPPSWIIRKWSLSTVGDYAHIFTMGHVTKDLVDKLARDLEQANQGDWNEGSILAQPYSPSEIKPQSRI
ncbi:MAG: histidine decarboxylase [Leptolyngbyaceae cyanobacterium MO_188.B28]|nr:histidine decarboxylase [Leptolyngbyaceae cyanobacterium MO_188.B28]